MGQSVNVTMQFLASFSIAQSFMTLMCHLQVCPGSLHTPSVLQCLRLCAVPELIHSTCRWNVMGLIMSSCDNMRR